MIERITSAGLECIRDLPFTPDVRNCFEKVGGNVQLNFRYREEGVIHVSPISLGLSQDETLICERWIYPYKPFYLARISRIAGLIHKNIRVPNIQVIGDVPCGDKRYPFWLDEYVQGESLSQLVFLNVEPKVYVDILIWMARFHSMENGSRKLASYYSSRLDAFSKVLNDPALRSIIGNEDADWLLRLTEFFKQCVSSTIHEEEKVSFIHGDLRGDNILVAADGRIVILDFEQGVNGGDWYSDVAKLLIPESSVLPDVRKKYRYTPPFDISVKRDLVRVYIEESERVGHLLPDFIYKYVASGDVCYIEERNKLHRFDNMMSFLIMRYLSGWDFNIDPKTGRRGVRFIIDLIKSEYG